MSNFYPNSGTHAFQALTFLVHNQTLAPSYSVPELDQYQSQKNIQVVSVNGDPLCFGNADQSTVSASGDLAEGSAVFFDQRLAMALGQNNNNVSSHLKAPTYFPGAIIPGPGGSNCSEFERGNLLFDQFVHLLSFDHEMQQRLCQYGQTGPATEITEQKKAAAVSRLFCREAEQSESWPWHHIEAPRLYFVHQASTPVASDQNVEKIANQALQNLANLIALLYKQCVIANYSDLSLIKLLSLISDAWFSPSSGLAPVTWDHVALTAARQTLQKHQSAITATNLLPFCFELEAMTSHISLAEKRESFARGVFAGNFIDVAMAPLTSIKATEFCVRERLFDEVINLSSRGFAPVVINEYGLVADGNHRLTASYVWNILKYAQDLEWSMDNEEFQERVAGFAEAVSKGLLKEGTTVSPVSLHQALSHLASFLCRPDWRARLNSYTRPLLKRHDFIHELPVVVLPEYLSGAVVKSNYDEGTRVERACPSIYEAMSLNEHLVLPPRASYHFTDAALLPWFTVLKSSCGTKRRSGTFNRRPRLLPKK